MAMNLRTVSSNDNVIPCLSIEMDKLENSWKNDDCIAGGSIGSYYRISRLATILNAGLTQTTAKHSFITCASLHLLWNDAGYKGETFIEVCFEAF